MKRKILSAPLLIAALCSCADIESDETAGSDSQGTELGESHQALTEVLKNDGTQSIVAGRGRDGVAEIWKEQCVTGPVQTTTQNNVGILALDQAMTSSELNQTLNASFKGKAQFGLLGAGGHAAFARTTMSSSRSINLVYSHQFESSAQRLDTTKLSWIVPKTDPAWPTRCGDRFVSEIKQGGELYILIKIEFASEAEKRAYEGSLSGNYGPFEAAGAFGKGSSSFGERAMMTIRAFQRGGDTQALGKIVGPDIAQNGVVCSPSNMHACVYFLVGAMQYARDVFPASATKSPAATGFVLEDWRVVNAGPAVQDVPLGAQWTRAALALKYQTQVDVTNRCDALQHANYYGAPPSFVVIAQSYCAQAQVNANALTEASKKCYDKFSYPPTSAQVTACADANKDGALAALGYKDLSDWTTKLDVPLAKSSFQGRNDFVKQQAADAGWWGNWGDWLMCPAGTHVIGLRQYVKSACGSGCDDTGVVMLDIVCADWLHSNVVRNSFNLGFIEGMWHPEATCTRGVMNGLQLVSEPPQGSDGDDTAVNRAIGMCVSAERVEPVGGTPWGAPGPIAYCPAGTAICGIQQRIELPLPLNKDYTGLNGVNLACCAY